MLKEVYDSFKVQLGAQQVEEHILAIAFIELCDNTSKLVLHGKGT